ncbi:MAG: WD40 repeat protein [Saprospiraceae bacterium]|jgi:WD40 repeat protein
MTIYMKQKILQLGFTLLCMLVYTASFSQDCYSSFLQDGITAYKLLDFEKAINQFKAAKICDDLPTENEVDEWISKAQSGYIEAIKKARKDAEDALVRAQSLALTAKSILELQKNNDATKAFRYGQYALSLDDNVESRAAFYESFYQLESKDRKNFYIRDIKVTEKIREQIRFVDFIDHGQTVIVETNSGDPAKLYDFDGNQFDVLPSDFFYFNNVAYNEKNGLLVTSAPMSTPTVMAYHLKNGKRSKEPLFYYECPESQISALDISYNGDKIAVCLNNGAVHILNAKGKLLYLLKKENTGVKYLAFSPDDHLVLAYGRLIKVVKLGASGYEVLLEKEERGFYEPRVALSPNNEYLLIDGTRKSRIIGIAGDSIADRRNMIYHDEIGNFSTDNIFASIGNRIINLKNKEYAQNFPQEVWMMKFSPGRNFLAAIKTGKTGHLWRAGGYQYYDFGTLGGHTSSMTKLNFSPDSTHIITASTDQTFKIWNPKLKAAVEVPVDTARLKQALVIDGELAIVLARGNELIVKKANGENRNYYKLPVDKILAISDNGKYLFALGSGDSREIWNLDIDTGKINFEVGISGGDGADFADFSNDDQALFFKDSRSGYFTQVWDFKNGKTRNLSGSNSPVLALKWSPDNTRVAAINSEGYLLVWNVSKGLDQVTLENSWVPHPDFGCNNLSFSNDGQNIITCGKDKVATLWDISGNLLAHLKGHNESITDGDFSPDGKYIVTSAKDYTAKVWAKDGSLLATLEHGFVNIEKVRFSDDGRYIVTNYGDYGIKIWPFDPQLIVEYLESFGIPDLTVKDKQKYGIK